LSALETVTVEPGEVFDATQAYGLRVVSCGAGSMLKLDERPHVLFGGEQFISGSAPWGDARLMPVGSQLVVRVAWDEAAADQLARAGSPSALTAGSVVIAQGRLDGVSIGAVDDPTRVGGTYDLTPWPRWWFRLAVADSSGDVVMRLAPVDMLGRESELQLLGTPIEGNLEGVILGGRANGTGADGSLVALFDGSLQSLAIEALATVRLYVSGVTGSATLTAVWELRGFR